MTWAGVISDFLTGPYSRRTRENGILFGNIECMVQTSAQRRRNLTMEHTYISFFLGAKFWTYVFPGRWFGRGWPTSLAPLTWPPRGPDLTIPNNSLWGSINKRVSVPRCNTNEECHRAEEGVFHTNAPTHVTVDKEAPPLLCPASGCTYGSTGM